MKNKLIDLNNHLFAQMERLNDESITGDMLVEEINRADAVAKVSMQIIANGKLALQAEEFKSEYSRAEVQTPRFLVSSDE